MSLLFALLLTLVIVFIIWFVLDHKKTIGTYPKIFRDFTEDIRWKMTHSSEKSEFNPKNIQPVGYEYNDKVKSAIRRLEKREKTFDRHENLGRLTEFKDATETAFVLGDLMGFNAYYRGGDGFEDFTDPEALENAKTFYNRVIRRLRKKPNVVNNPDFMLDRIENFHEDHNIQLPPDFLEVRVANNNFAGGRVRYENDTQNVHDRNISDKFVHSYNIIKEEKPAHVNDIDVDNVKNQKNAKINEIKKSCRKYFSNDKSKYENVKTTIDKIATTENHVVSKYNDTEMNILLNVWDRINKPENAENAISMQENLANALNDGANVCAVGRVSRILDSLTLLDVDEKIATPPISNQMLRDEIFTITNNTLNDELGFMNKKEAYEKGENIPEIDYIKKQIRNKVFQQYEGNGPTKENLESILEESFAAL